MQMGTCASDLNHISEANGVDMYHDPLSKTLPVFSISSHLFLIESRDDRRNIHVFSWCRSGG